MIALVTDLPEARTELSDVIRLFFPMEEITEEGLPRLVHSHEGGRHTAVWITEKGPVTRSLEVPVPEGDPIVRLRMLRRGAKLAAFEAMQQAEDLHLPWGALTGIRPAHLIRQLIQERGSLAAARETLERDFHVSPARVQLLADILAQQEPIFRWGDDEAVDIYVGIPFCKSRCLYCSFLSVDLSKTRCDVAAYGDALVKEIAHAGEFLERLGKRPHALYVGGGTPTALGQEPLDRILAAMGKAFPGYVELTCEAGRPDTLNPDMFRMMMDRGVSRISINPQTFNDATLERIGRSHTSAETLRSLDEALAAGFRNINMDLIMGLPGETVADAAHTLSVVRGLPIQNLTVHTLTIKRSSALHEHLARWPLPSCEDTEAMVELGAQTARDMGMAPYYLYRQKAQRGNLENVGYTLPGQACIYNVDIMEETHHNLALGAGAISKRMIYAENRHERLSHPKSVPLYMEKLDELCRENETFFTQKG